MNPVKVMVYALNGTFNRMKLLPMQYNQQSFEKARPLMDVGA